MTKLGLIYLLLIGAIYLVCWRKSPDKTISSLRTGATALVKLLPLLLAIFALVGLLQEFVPQRLIEEQLGATGGWHSVLIGGGLGAIAMGPPVAAFPLAGSLLNAGALPAAVAAFIVAWVSVGIISLPFEITIFGVRYALLRNGLTFLTALLIGWLIGMVI
ncbi:MAG: permease [Desulfuromonadaceae bacterium]|nr:permease [Desulfuromonadaceae bacterium]